jgi:hypothetical protein
MFLREQDDFSKWSKQNETNFSGSAHDVFNFIFCRQSCNKVAHVIAQHVKELGVLNFVLYRGCTSFCICFVC